MLRLQGAVEDLPDRDARSHHVDIVVEPVEPLLTVDAMPCVPDPNVVQGRLDGVGTWYLALGRAEHEAVSVGSSSPLDAVRGRC